MTNNIVLLKNQASLLLVFLYKKHGKKDFYDGGKKENFKVGGRMKYDRRTNKSRTAL